MAVASEVLVVLVMPDDDALGCCSVDKGQADNHSENHVAGPLTHTRRSVRKAMSLSLVLRMRLSPSPSPCRTSMLRRTGIL
jgi:hypothetical protein